MECLIEQYKRMEKVYEDYLLIEEDELYFPQTGYFNFVYNEVISEFKKHEDKIQDIFEKYVSDAEMNVPLSDGDSMLPMFHTIYNFSNIYIKKSVYEIGCREGLLLAMLRDYDFEVCGCDKQQGTGASRYAVKIAKQLDLDVNQKDAIDDLLKRNQNYDLIVSKHVLQKDVMEKQDLKKLIEVTTKYAQLQIHQVIGEPRYVYSHNNFLNEKTMTTFDNFYDCVSFVVIERI